MFSRSSGVALVSACAAIICTACHTARTVPAVATAPAHPNDGYCWWAVFRSPLPADSVVAHYVRAYARVGLTDVTSSRAGDTVWARAGPTVMGGAHDDGTYAARIVAYQHGDSTHFRTYVLAAPPAGGWPLVDSTRNVAERLIGFCGELGRAAQAQGTAPRGPDGEEKLEVWGRY